MNEPDETVIVSKTVYENLLEDSKFLYALKACGVDNWEGYDEARKMMRDND